MKIPPKPVPKTQAPQPTPPKPGFKVPPKAPPPPVPQKKAKPQLPPVDAPKGSIKPEGVPRIYRTQAPPQINSRSPTEYQVSLASIDSNRHFGPGFIRIDNWCHENGYAWSLLNTYDKDGQIKTLVIVGQLIEGSSEAVTVRQSNSQAWDAYDAALDSVASYLESNHGPAKAGETLRRARSTCPNNQRIAHLQYRGGFR